MAYLHLNMELETGFDLSGVALLYKFIRIDTWYVFCESQPKPVNIFFTRSVKTRI